MNYALDVIVAALAVPVCLASSCRLIYLHWRQHKPEYIVIYLGAAAGAIYALGEAWLLRAGIGIALLLASMAAHLWVSRVTWRKGPPLFVER